jgi:hypothetical protein
MLSRRVTRDRRFNARARSAAVCSKVASKRETAVRASSSRRPTLSARVVAPRGSSSAGAFAAAALDLAQPVLQRLDQRGAPLRVVEQVVLQERVALDHPHVAEHLVQHPCRAAGAALGAQLVDDPPALLAEQPQHDLAVGERGVVVRDLAQPGGCVDGSRGEGRKDRGVHRGGSVRCRDGPRDGARRPVHAKPRF